MTEKKSPKSILDQEYPYPFQRHLGFILSDWNYGYCRLELPLESFLMNMCGIPHGGIHATLFDTALGYPGCYSNDPSDPRFTMTLNLGVNFGAKSKGDKLLVDAKQTSGGRQIYFAEGRATDNHGSLIATDTGAFRYRTGQKNAQVKN